jgi:uncharacterized membrane protein
MKYSLRTELPSIIIIILSFLLAGYFYAHFPDRVITHWDFYGTPNGYSSRAFGAWFFPALIAGIYGLFVLLPFIDPKRERYASFEKVFHRVKTLLTAVFFALYAITGLANLGYPIKINFAISFIIGLLFIILGNYMGKVKQNWFMGFRFPWTLSSENVWNRTHRFGGFVMILTGVLMILTPYLPEFLGMALFIIGILAMTLGTMLYSYLIFKAEKSEGK